MAGKNVISTGTWLPRTLFEANSQTTYEVMLNIGAPGTKWRKRTAELMENATHNRIVSAEDKKMFYVCIIYVQKDEMQEDAALMQYGAPSGDPRFLRALTDFLSQEYGDPVEL